MSDCITTKPTIPDILAKIRRHWLEGNAAELNLTELADSIEVAYRKGIANATHCATNAAVETLKQMLEKVKVERDSAYESAENALWELAEHGSSCKNAKEMYDALKTVLDFFIEKDDQTIGVPAMMSTVRKAISSPPRNCDVGDCEAQIERFHDFCSSNQYYIDEFHGCDCKEECPIGKLIGKNPEFADNCMLVWAQMPYKEG